MKKIIIGLILCLSISLAPGYVQPTPHEYIKINLAELYKIIDTKDESRLKLNYVVRGIVYQNSDLQKQNIFGLIRIFMWCCVVDAVEVGLKVTPATSINVVAGKWVDVYGHLGNTQLPSTLGENTNTNGMGIPNAIPKDWIFVADKVKSINPPNKPYMNTINTKEPYYY